MKLHKKLIAHFKNTTKEKKKDIFFGTTLFLFAIIVNQYFGNIGLFPHDSASHFDTGNRILYGEHPVKNYWIISGFIIDYIQSLFFLLLGTNWQAYIFHASVFNGILTLFFFLFLRNFKLRLSYAIFFSFSFSILAYPSSATPFVDHHSTFFSFLAILFLIQALKFNKKIFWFLIPFLLSLSFLSKPVPAAYFVILISLIIVSYVVLKKDHKPLLPLILGCIISILSFLLIIFINDIKIFDFYNQYILYPQSIGASRFSMFFKMNVLDILSQYKFIFLLLFLLIIFYFFFKKSKTYIGTSLIELTTIILTTTLFILHQVLTKNQIFINFLIPFLLSYIFILFPLKKKISIFLLIFCIVLTLKYHLRFNEKRKFHELSNVNFKNSLPASLISNKLSGLQWITPQRPNDVSKEIEEINKIKKILQEKNNFILLSNYSFFSTILNKRSHSPTRWFTFDGTDYPRDSGKFKDYYKKLFIKNIKDNKVDKIFINLAL